MSEYGKAIGHFHSCISEFNSSKITNTITDFHNTTKYFTIFKNLMNKSTSKRKNEVEEELEFVQQFSKKFKEINQWLQTGKIPSRVCHNDTKIDNILFDTKNNKVKSIIDLDTIMCNSIIYDFGDAIRTSCNSTSENDSNINNVNFNFEFFKAFSKGYLKETKSFISKEELNLLPFSGILLALEQSIRFFTDYLNNNIYYTVDYPKQNLDKGLNQLMLAKKMLLQEKEMENYINSISKS
jgi:Ser/Thr protein kinase RdoA (MazF antagonist)